MLPDSAVQIAEKQRYLHLLGKVRENKTLTSAEITELRSYEQMTKKKKTHTVDKTGKKSRKVTGSKKSKKKKSKKTTRVRANQKQVKYLGLVCETMTEADSRLAGTKTLAELIGKKKTLKKAWQRGRFLRALKEQSANLASVPEAAADMGLTVESLTAVLADDREAADVWNQARLEVAAKVKSALINRACEGSPPAVKHVMDMIRREIARPKADFTHVTTSQLIELTGKARQTIHEWFTKYGLSRNADKTYNLGEFIRWFEEFTLKKNVGIPASAADPLKTAKARKLEIDIAQYSGRLLDRDNVIAGQLARYQVLLNAIDRKPQELGLVCGNQPPEKITEILTGFFEDLRRSQCRVPEHLQLAPESVKKLQELLETLRAEGSG